MTKNEKLSLLITPEKFIEERPAMISFDNNEIQECIFTAFNVINAQCANLPQEVWNYMHVTKLDPPQVVDVNNNLYRNEYEIDQFFQAIVAQTHYNLTMGNDFSQGSTSFSSGGINAAIQRPEKRDILAPSVVLFLQNARLYNIQQYGISKSSNEGGSCSIWDKFITREIGDDRYIQKMQENANVGSIAYVNENKMVSFKDPNEITFKDYFADKIKDVDGDYKPIQDIENLAFFGNDGDDAATRNFVTQARNSWLWDYLYTYSKGNMVITYDEITKLFTYYLSNFNNNLNHDPTLDTQQFWWTKVARDDGIIAQQIAKLDERIKVNTTNIATNTQNITTTNSKVALNTTAIENLTNTLNSKRFLDFVGEYNDATTYTIAQVVSFENELWICKVESVVGVSPKVGANNQWELLTHVDIDLSNYYTKLETEGFLQTLNTKIDNEVANVVKTTDPIVNLQGNLTTPNIEANTTNFQSSSATNLDVTTQATFQKTIDENDNVKTIANKEYVDRRISEMLAGSATDATKLAEFFNNMYPIGSVVYTSNETSDVPPVHKLVQLYPDCFFEITDHNDPSYLAIWAGQGGYRGSNNRYIQRNQLPNTTITTTLSGAHWHTLLWPEELGGSRFDADFITYRNTGGSGGYVNAIARAVSGAGYQAQTSERPITTDANAHSHKFNLNDNVTQQQFDVRPKRIIVRMWKVIRTIFTPENVKQMIAGFTEQDITQLAIDAFTQSIVPIQNQIDGVNTNVEALGNEVQALDNRVGQFNDEINNNANNITNLENRVNNLNQLLENQQLENVLNNAALKNVENTFTQNQIFNQQIKVGNFYFQPEGGGIRWTPHEDNKWLYFGNPNTSKYFAGIDLNDRVQLQGIKTPTQNSHAANKEYVDTKFNEANTTITNNTTNITNLQTRVDEVNTNLTTLEASVNNANTTLATQQASITNLQTNAALKDQANTFTFAQTINTSDRDNMLKITTTSNQRKGLEFISGTSVKAGFWNDGSSKDGKYWLEVCEGELNVKSNSVVNIVARDKTINLSNNGLIARMDVEFGTRIKMGYGGGLIKFTPEDNTTKTLQFFENNPTDSKRLMLKVADPTEDLHVVNKRYLTNNSVLKATIDVNKNELTLTRVNNLNGVDANGDFVKWECNNESVKSFIWEHYSNSQVPKQLSFHFRVTGNQRPYKVCITNYTIVNDSSRLLILSLPAFERNEDLNNFLNKSQITSIKIMAI